MTRQRQILVTVTYNGLGCIIDTKAEPYEEPIWNPVKTRPMDSEEREYWSEHFGYPLDDEDAVIFNCKMPEDGQEILVSFSTFVSMDKCEIDCGCYGLEENGDWDGITAWMPLPKPYKEGKR